MANSLEKTVEQVIDWVMRNFRPDDRGAFERCDSELRRVELLLRSGEPEPNISDLLAQVCSARIFLAADMGDAEEVLRQSDDFVESCPRVDLNYFNVAILRLRALHTLGHHSQELQEALEVARKPEIHGSEYVFLLEHLSKRHPGSIPADEQLSAKMLEAISALNTLGYETLLPIASSDIPLEEAALHAAAELRRVNREKGEALLAGL